jgi:hypothetical protein
MATPRTASRTTAPAADKAAPTTPAAPAVPSTPAPVAPAVPSTPAPAAPALNLSALTPVRVEPPKRAGKAGAAPRDNTLVVTWLKDLNSTRKNTQEVSDGLSIKIPAAGMGELRSRLVQAADTLQVGVSIKPTHAEFTAAKHKDNDVIEVVFAVKPRKQNKATLAKQAADKAAADKAAADKAAADKAPETAENKTDATDAK